MRVVALISGGKDSCYNMMQCVSAGHSIVALANLMPQINVPDELDSYMYQTVGHQAIDLYAEAMDVPLYRRTIEGSSLHTGREYSQTEGDEVEDLYQLLKLVKEKEGVEAVSVGAILSDYQRVRVENVCVRLQLQPLAYLWRRDQAALLREIISSGLHALIIKVAAYGLDPQRHLGKSLAEMEEYLHELSEKYGVHICGEGGEYETFTVDCPLFKKKIVIDSMETIIHSADAFAPVGYLRFTRMHTEDKRQGSGGRPLPLCRCPCQNTIDRMTEELEYADKTPDVQGGCPSSAERSCHSEPDLTVRDAVFSAGQIALVPCSMQLVNGPLALQARLCFGHMEKVLRAMDSKLTLAHVLQAHIYITHCDHAVVITETWNTKLQDVQVSQSLLLEPKHSL
ncbi:diphthine--ammonia ligase [Garra rufa]|uniref:diphthine--ammonia ligase n=1 Tax=Garra rufa TaxID=137080 RepID=UPI003CCEAAA4